MQPLEIVFWRDAYFLTDGADGEHDDYIVRTVGWVSDKHSRFLKVTSERQPHGDVGRAVTYIPYDMVVRRVPLQEARRPKDAPIPAEG